ncbi:MAG TPA: glycosyl hydrolase family 79 C-terminal domain-containing protein [Mucilaginibacter sp.]|jgi:hypothetical protein|nr:glycosyl hydrolase family 79 C-terminal domain-containing protein [Mucilaginibacter sp.]
MNKNRIVIVLVAALLSCKKEPQGSLLPVASGLPVTVTIDQSHPGNRIAGNFQGLSYETGLLIESPEILNADNTELIQLIKNLGPGVLRIGGNSSDNIAWTGHERTPANGKDELTTTEVDRLSAFSKAIGWPVLFGLNLGNNNAAAAADEARYVYKSLQDNVYAMALGNEPDVYYAYPIRTPSYNADNYQGEWEAYKSAIQLAVPQAAFAGPGTAYNTDWITAFVKKHNNHIKLLDAHYYAAGPASDPTINYHTILKPSWKLDNTLQVIRNESATYHVPFRITESNSIYGGGKVGTSDVFASALWALDLMWAIAGSNGEGINFHGGNGAIYSPIAIEHGIITARPVYYAMLAFKYGSAGNILPVSIDQPQYNCSAHACANADHTWSITLINKDESNRFSFTIQLTKTASNIKIVRLTAPGITSKTGTTFAGSMVNAGGTFKPAAGDQYAVNKKSFVINVPAGSAAVVTVQ